MTKADDAKAAAEAQAALDAKSSDKASAADVVAAKIASDREWEYKAHSETLAKSGLDVTLAFDTSDVNAQIDVLRKWVRRLLAQVGPVPDEMNVRHDMGWVPEDEWQKRKAEKAVELQARIQARDEAIAAAARANPLPIAST